ncbi:tautomerase family protein [Acidobacteria bacterium AB60]|nr:tautomerase family protein [Acidobacteria bacterium AB60]
MPLVRISLHTSAAENRKSIADAVYQAMRETIGIPEGDRFLVVTSHAADELFVDPNYLGIQRTEKFILVHIFLSEGRTVEQKQALFRSIAMRLQNAIGVSQEDVMTVLTENSYVDWSFGNGEAQYVINPPAWVRSRSAEGN